MNDIIRVFNECKNSNKWVEGIRNGNNSVGITFENMLGLKENSNPKADFKGIEIKTKFSKRFSEISLFSCLPFNYADIDTFREMAGTQDKIIPEVKTLQFTINSKKKIRIDKEHFLKLYFDNDFGKVSLKIKDSNNTTINEVFWLTEQLNERLNEKCTNIVFINARKKIENNKHYFNYYRLRSYKLKSNDMFYELLEKGVIYITFNIGVHRSGEFYGMPYYHGINFRINEKDLELMFNKTYEIA